MTAAELVRLALEQRERFRAVILARFEVTGDHRDRLRRAEVAQELAHALRMSVANNYFQRKVLGELAALGAVPINPHNQRWWRGIRRRTGC